MQTIETMFGDAPPMPGQDKFSQATQRSFGVFTDQHGREWGADIEKSNSAPCGPLSLRTSAAGMVGRPPLIPPQKYLRVHAMSRRILIDYELWANELEAAHSDYDQNVLAQATRMYGVKAHQMIKEADPTLFDVCGPPPEPIERVLAAQSGNRWALGLDGEKPTWAEDFWPTPKESARKVFPSAAEERGAHQQAVAKTFPHHLGFGSYELSSGQITPQKSGKEYAQQAEAALQAGEPVPAYEPQPVGAGSVDPSWEG